MVTKWNHNRKDQTMKLLHIDSSILGDNSVTRQLSAAVVARFEALHPGLEIVRHDLGADPLPHLSGAHLGGQAPAEELARSAAALDAFLAADIVVVGAPMYNFGISSQLKSWIDRIVIAGKTFRYGADGPEGLAGGKTVVIASGRGGLYGPGTPFASADHQETHLRALFGFIGLPEIEIVRAEGVAMGPEPRQKAIDDATAAIAQLQH